MTSSKPSDAPPASGSSASDAAADEAPRAATDGDGHGGTVAGPGTQDRPQTEARPASTTDDTAKISPEHDGRSASVVCYAFVAASAIFPLGVVGALLVWLLQRRFDPLMDFHGRQALDVFFTAITTVAVVALLAFGGAAVADDYPTAAWLPFLLSPILPFVGVPFILLALWGAISALKRERRRLPLLIRVLSRQRQEAPPARPPDA